MRRILSPSLTLVVGTFVLASLAAPASAGSASANVSVSGGVLIFVYPTFGLVSLTMIVAVTLVAQGITSLLVSGGLPDWTGRKWLIISAVLSIVAGLLVLFDLPSSAGWTLGTIVGAVLVLQGVSLTLLGLEVRHVPARTSAHA